MEDAILGNLQAAAGWYIGRRGGLLDDTRPGDGEARIEVLAFVDRDIVEGIPKEQRPMGLRFDAAWRPPITDRDVGALISPDRGELDTDGFHRRVISAKPV
jgi:hypothetical protein